MGVFGFSQPSPPPRSALSSRRGGRPHILTKQKLTHIFHFSVTVKLISENKTNLALSLRVRPPTKFNMRFSPKISISQAASCNMPIYAKLAKYDQIPLHLQLKLYQTNANRFEVTSHLTKKEKMNLTIQPKHCILIDPHELALLINEN